MKINSLIKTTATLLAVLFIGTALLSACKKEKETDESTNRMEKTSYAGTHDFTAPDTDEYLVKNGTTEYKLVYSEEEIVSSKSAREEFSYLFERATGRSIQIIPDTGLSHTENGMILS